VRHLHWHWPPGVPQTSSIVPVLIVVALLVGTCAVRHYLMLRLFHRPEPPPRPSFSDESLRHLLDTTPAPTTTRHSQANQSPQRV